jgi:hypothetical protein
MNDNAGDRRGPRVRPRSCQAGLLAAAAGIALLATGCGGGSNTAKSGASNASSAGQVMSTYARCLQIHGLSVYASPHRPGSALPPAGVPFVHGWTIVGDGLNSPGYPAANKACRHLLPTTAPPAADLHQQLIRALKGAACVRARGYPGFPDPTDQPGYLYWPPLPSSIDRSSPQFESTMKACGVWDPPQDQ